MKLLALIRWKNLLIIALVQILIKYALLEPFTKVSNLSTTLQPLGFILLVISTLCLAAAGYIINDIYDRTADEINKPEKVIIGHSISERKATNLFIGLNVVGVALGYLISFEIGKSNFIAIFIIISGLLYLYSAYFKQYVLIDNISISMIVALSIIIVGIYELLPNITDANRNTQLTFFDIILDYALFAFGVNLVRELVKDLEDTEGDKGSGYASLSTYFGIKTAKMVSFSVNCFLTLGVVYYLIENLYKNNILVIYFLGLIVAPLIFVSVKLLQAKNKTDFKRISSLLKIVMLTGILSMLILNISQ